MQKVSPGIIMIVEAENASLILQPLKKIEDNIVQALKKEGLTVVDTVHDSDNVIIVILEEGYVISHIWPVQKYCAFDIHFWSKFEKHQNVKDSLLLAVGSKNKASSSFRIVAGGMFDVRTWEGDEKIRGPQNTIPCSDIEIPPENIEVGEKSTMIDIVLEESMKIFGDGEDVVVVVCGQKESEPCRSLDLLQEKHNLDDIQVFWTCPHANEFMEDFEKILFNCELDASRALRNSLTDGKKIEAIVFDSTASYPMSQILFKIFSDFKNRLMLRKDPSVVAISLGDSKLWHSIFVNRFRREMIRRDPVYSSEVLFVGHDTNIKLNIVRVDDLFVKKN
uniref:Uncharacterized protein n=2 Tax=Corethron hystrix TaxID=216773 RepID=A0A7S1BJZ0_9STRA|mmetsp:Transcript_28513/g.65218  ORF Transcript_28513/g.65218 Transcript_28513/m.65218 type:complete len:335 (+) Transcript_28513:328-1332(+)